MTGHYAVFGHPVAHSLSPRIHAVFAKQTGVDQDYRAVDAAPDEFAAAVAAFAAAGGAGASITLPHKERALALCATLGDRVHTRYWADLPNLGAFDTIVNATSAGRGDGGLTLPFSLAAPRALAVDLSYGEAAIPFLAWAGAARCEYRVDGLGMLVEQAAEAFALWHGVRPHTDPVYDALSARSDVLTTAD